MKIINELIRLESFRSKSVEEQLDTKVKKRIAFGVEIFEKM